MPSLIAAMLGILVLPALPVTAPADEKPAAHLKFFGFAGVDCGADDSGDEEAKSNYIDEVAGFTNVAHMGAGSPDENLAARIERFSKAHVRAILDVQVILFDRRKDNTTGSGNRVWLRSDAEQRWNDFVQRNQASLTAEKVAAIYVVDEPVWNGLSRDEFEKSLRIISASRLSLPTLAVEAWAAVNRIMVPELLDWVGFDRYDSLDPASDPAWLADLKAVKEARTRPEQRIVIVASTQWLPYYQKDAGVRPEDMEKIARSYHRVAESNPEVIGLLGYIWPGGLDDPQQLGARRLPDNVQREFRRIGKAVTGK